ncbi:hypothetical protein NDU88_001354 [Pleurodeles waltl]|uniref:Uncharacterized protein n=1 Tax=Pleurodeles waltl TaxID=8319 RepID=A0AAV7KPA0_PLEWA|nr:hypothetical protein NDU88_001354 [Pleurodeles waltl]
MHALHVAQPPSAALSPVQPLPGPATPGLPSVCSHHPHPRPGPFGGWEKEVLIRREPHRRLLTSVAVPSHEPLFQFRATQHSGTSLTHHGELCGFFPLFGQILGRWFNPGPGPLNHASAMLGA